jgi:hypothetical protein
LAGGEIAGRCHVGGGGDLIVTSKQQLLDGLAG